jgi:hypothetical protein
MKCSLLSRACGQLNGPYNVPWIWMFLTFSCLRFLIMFRLSPKPLQEAIVGDRSKCLQKGAADLRGLFEKVSQNIIQGTFREHSGNIQGIFREHSGNIQGTFRNCWESIRTSSRRCSRPPGTFWNSKPKKCDEYKSTFCYARRGIVHVYICSTFHLPGNGMRHVVTDNVYVCSTFHLPGNGMRLVATV